MYMELRERPVVLRNMVLHRMYVFHATSSISQRDLDELSL
jgi:hypothetical protein